MDHRKDCPHFKTAARDSCATGRGRARKPLGTVKVISKRVTACIDGRAKSCTPIRSDGDSTLHLDLHDSRLCNTIMQDGNGGDSFLPRIQSVFYAVFDEKIGPKIVYQVPEGLIASSSTAQQSILGNGGDYISSSSPSPDPTSPPPRLNASSSDLTSRNSSISLTSPTDYFRRGRQIPSPQKRPLSSQRTLFNFSDISMYVIPPSALCGRLVICSTRKHRIIGFPVELPGGYKRNYFRYNLCLVFERGADLSCYEPIVRKASRVLKACEVSIAALYVAENGN